MTLTGISFKLATECCFEVPPDKDDEVPKTGELLEKACNGGGNVCCSFRELAETFVVVDGRLEASLAGDLKGFFRHSTFSRCCAKVVW